MGSTTEMFIIKPWNDDLTINNSNADDDAYDNNDSGCVDNYDHCNNSDDCDDNGAFLIFSQS